MKDVESKQFISTWRMFTKEGIPFGNVISFGINQISLKNLYLMKKNYLINYFFYLYNIIRIFIVHFLLLQFQ